LFEAVEKFDERLGTNRNSFLSFRITQRIWDQVRTEGWMPRSLIKNRQKVNEALRLLAVDGIFHPSTSEVAEKSGLSEKIVEEVLGGKGQVTFFSEMEGDEERGSEVVDHLGHVPADFEDGVDNEGLNFLFLASKVVTS